MLKIQPTKSYFPTGKSGFTLIEALVALGVLTVGILTMYSMQTGSVRGNFRASQISTASTQAMDRIEKINAMAYDDVLLDDRHHDGTGQDANGNGVDDDDEGAAVDGISNFGLDQHTAAAADHVLTGFDGFTLYYNVAIGQPLDNMKTIRLIVVREADQQPLVFDYTKAAPL